MLIPEFIARCDAYCRERGQSRVWLSKRIFSDTFKIDNLASGKTDIGVRRLAKAVEDLNALERVAVHDATLAASAASGAENGRGGFIPDEPGSSVGGAA